MQAHIKSHSNIITFFFFNVQMASDLLKDLLASGKVTLHHCDVAAMPLADSIVDKVFHCNCYYFWPDLRKGSAELHRVMKPGEAALARVRPKQTHSVPYCFHKL